MTESIIIDWNDSNWNLPKQERVKLCIRPVPARRPYHRCESCRFLDRAETGWRCASWPRWLMISFPAMHVTMQPITRLLALRSGTPFAAEYAQPVNPGWFACPLWLPGESESAEAWRGSHYREFMVLAVLAGEPEQHAEFRLRRGSQVDVTALEEGEEALSSAWAVVPWWGMLGTVNDLAYSLGAALGSASAKAAGTFRGLAELITTGYLTSSEGAFVETEHANCRCAVIDEVEEVT